MINVFLTDNSEKNQKRVYVYKPYLTCLPSEQVSSAFVFQNGKKNRYETVTKSHHYNEKKKKVIFHHKHSN
jgi:hypothetical protein